MKYISKNSLDNMLHLVTGIGIVGMLYSCATMQNNAIESNEKIREKNRGSIEYIGTIIEDKVEEWSNFQTAGIAGILTKPAEPLKRYSAEIAYDGKTQTFYRIGSPNEIESIRNTIRKGSEVKVNSEEGYIIDRTGKNIPLIQKL